MSEVVNLAEKSTTPRRPKRVSVTGRDGYLVLQALAYTILTIEALPDRWQEWSNKEQMKKLLHVWSRGYADHFLENARHHITGAGRPVPVITGWGKNIVALQRND
jgi:hypothetical protein